MQLPDRKVVLFNKFKGEALVVVRWALEILGPRFDAGSVFHPLKNRYFQNLNPTGVIPEIVRMHLWGYGNNSCNIINRDLRERTGLLGGSACHRGSVLASHPADPGSILG